MQQRNFINVFLARHHQGH